MHGGGGEGAGPSLAAEGRRAGDAIPVVHVSVPVVVITFLHRCRAVEPTAADRPVARLGAAADDQLAVVEHVARPGDVHGDSEVSDEILSLPSHRLVVRQTHHAGLLVRQHVGDELDQ